MPSGSPVPSRRAVCEFSCLDPQSQLIHLSAKGWCPFGFGKMTRFRTVKQGKIAFLCAFLGTCGDSATVRQYAIARGRIPGLPPALDLSKPSFNLLFKL